MTDTLELFPYRLPLVAHIHSADEAVILNFNTMQPEYIEVFYNRIRAHSTIGYRAPAEFEEDTRILKKSVL